MGRQMEKREALRRANTNRAGAPLGHHNTHFANINSQKDVWWYDIPMAKISDSDLAEINLLLYDHRTDELHHQQFPV